MTGNVLRSGQAEKGNQSSYFERLPHTSHRGSFDDGLGVGLVLQNLFRQLRVDVPGCHTVDSNPVGTPLAGPVARKLVHSGFCGGVRGSRFHAGDARYGSNVHDGAKGLTWLSLEKGMAGCREAKHGLKIGLPNLFDVFFRVFDGFFADIGAHIVDQNV